MAATEAESKRLFANALASMLNVVAGSLLLFALYRVLLVRLGAETLGLWSLLIASVSAARLSEMGVSGAATRFIAVARAQGDEKRAVRVAQTATTTLLIFGVLGAVLAQMLLPLLLGRFLRGAQLDIATAAMPWTLGAFAVGLAGSAVQSALDGCQRIDLRVWVSLLAQAALLATATILAKPFGLAGVAMAQGVQALVVLFGSWMLLRRQLRGLSWLPVTWDYATFRQILGYSALFQLNNVLLLILDPLVKFMLTHFGGLAATAYFEMANQMVQRLRQLPVSAAQVLVPAMTQAGIAGVDHIRDLYGRGYRAIFAVAVPIFSLAAVLVPAISRLWIGHAQPLFTGMMWICIAGWAVSTVGTPAYYGNIGTGTLVSNALGHTFTNITALVLGWFGGAWFGAVGVCIGYSAGLVVGGLFVQLAFMRRIGLELRSLIPIESRWLLTLSLLAVSIGLYVDAELAMSWRGIPEAVGTLMQMGLLTVLFLLVAGASLWMHPLRHTVSVRAGHLLRRAPGHP